MKGIEIGLVFAIGTSLAIGGHLLLSRQEEAARVHAVSSEVKNLRDEILREKDSTAPRSRNAGDSVPVGELLARDVTAANQLGERVADLAVILDKLETTTRALNARITGSRLALPSEEERKLQIERAQARLKELRKTATDALEKVRRIAVQSKVPFDEKRLLEPGELAALEDEPEFVAARDEAAAKARVVVLFEKKLADLHFSTVIDALPSEDANSSERVNQPQPSK